MLTPEFAAGVDDLLKTARRARTAIMCAESLDWRCHRRLVSDYLVAHKIAVQHIMSASTLRPHPLTPEARPQKNGTILYPPAGTLFPSR